MYVYEEIDEGRFAVGFYRPDAVLAELAKTREGGTP